MDSEIPTLLKTSIATVGILQPPLVIQKEDKTYDIISGRKRINCATLLGNTDLLCAVLPHNTPIKTLLTFLLHHEISSRRLTLPESAFFLKICLEHLDKNEAFGMLPDGYLPQKDPLQLLKLLHFDDYILKKLHFGQLTEKIIPDLLKLADEDRSRLTQLMGYLQLGGNKQKRLITLLNDIALREGISVVSIFNEEDLKGIIDHAAMNTPQKTNRIFDILQKRCTPRSTEAKELFQAQVRKLTLPENVELFPSPYFERDEVILSVRFQNFETCKNALPSLEKFLRNR